VRALALALRAREQHWVPIVAPIGAYQQNPWKMYGNY